MKAKFIRSEYDHINRNKILFYEYRGCTYEVIDFGWRGGTPLGWQHKNEQARIDQDLDNPKPKYKGESAQIGFDLFWEYVNS